MRHTERERETIVKRQKFNLKAYKSWGNDRGNDKLVERNDMLVGKTGKWFYLPM